MKKTYKIEVDCANCANKMEDAAKNTAGVQNATVNFMTQKMIVEFEEGQDAKSVMKDGIVKEGNVLKVDSFLNHQMDIKLLNQMGAEFKKRFADKNINKILTIEASGIGIACIVAEHFDVPVVFAKKSQSINLDGEMYVAEVESFTHKCKNNVIVSQKFLSEDDHVLIIDDFLANG